MDFNFKYVGEYDVSNIADKVNKFSEELWNDYSFRQDKHGVHKHTTTVPIIWKEPLNSNSIVYNDNNKYWNEYESIKEDINNLNTLLNNNVSKGEIESVLLIRLPKNKSIDKHMDRGSYFINHNRFHMPIITHEDVIFEISNEKKHLKTGEIWEINNNKKPHGVSNTSNIDRVHMLIDWKPL